MLTPSHYHLFLIAACLPAVATGAVLARRGGIVDESPTAGSERRIGAAGAASETPLRVGQKRGVAQKPSPPGRPRTGSATAHSSRATEVEARDTPNDSGDSITLTWRDSPHPSIETYEILWAESRHASSPPPPIDKKAQKLSAAAKKERHSRKDPSKYWQSVGTVLPAEQKKVFSEADPDRQYYFKVVAISESGARFASEIAGPVRSRAQWFNTDKLWIFLMGVIICFFVIFFIEWVKGGRQLFVRKIAGLEAVDEAIGRATEMGRPVVFIPGIMDLDNVQTLAGLTLLGHVAKSIAEYETKLDVPVSRSLVMTTGREVVKQAYLEAGRPDAYNEDMVHYLTDEQFGYVAGVNGIIVRDEPATCVYMGAFFAESLILAETGNSIGAIQIAGTAMPSQLPFFVAACDYTLIGEELFAASAYLSGDAKQLGSLKGQDIGKAIVMVAIVIGSTLATLGNMTGNVFIQNAHQFILSIFG